MAFADIPILSMLRTRLDWSQARQRVLAENVANSDTPRFRAHDLAPLKFEDSPLVASSGVTPVSLSRTDSGHIEGVGLSQSPFRNGNSAHFRSAAGRQCRESRRRDDEGGREPNGFPDSDSALHAKSQSHQDRAWQALNTGREEGNVGFSKDADDRGFRPASSGGAHAYHFRKHCQRGFDAASPGADPYRRKIPTFRSELDRSLDTRSSSSARCRPTIPHFA